MAYSLPQMDQADLPETGEAGFGALETPRGCLPLEALDVQTTIDGLLARTELAQTFVNVHAEPLEATYIFPLPDRAAVTRFRLEAAGRVIEGELKERSQARRDYTEAIAQGHRAAITEEERPGVFTMRVGNLPPGERAVVLLTLVGPLPYRDGEATFRFPLVVAPRYIPGAPLPGPAVGIGAANDTDATPDASRITPPVLLPGFPNPVRLSLAVAFTDSDLKPTDLRSSLHAVVGETDRAVRLQPGERVDRDFILRFRVGAATIRTALTLQPDADGVEGTFALTLTPPQSSGRMRPRDVVFVLDRSGSMSGWKMVAARRALGRMVDTLTERDRFAVLAFDDVIETPAELPAGLAPATDRHRFRAIEFLARIEARNGTEMAAPLHRAAELLTQGRSEPEGAAADRILVLITDGQIGNEDQILQQLAPRLQGVRVFALGIDQAVNAAFLRRLADLGGGTCELVESEDRLDAAMDVVHRRIATPVLTDLKLEAAGLSIVPNSVTPARLPDLFTGAPLLLMGRYRGQSGALALQARNDAGGSWTTVVRPCAEAGVAVAAVWARARVRDLEDRYVTSGRAREAIEKEIVATSLRFGVLCRFTAFVAVDRSAVVNAGGENLQVVQPVELPAGWEAQAQFGPAGGALACRAMPAMMTLSNLPVDALLAGGDELAAAFADAEIASPAEAKEYAAHAPKRRKQDGRANRGGGLLRRLLGLFGRAGAGAPIDLTPYQQRARELLEKLERLAASDAASRRALLQVCAAKLDELFADLCQAGSRLPTVARLGEAALALRTLLPASSADADVHVVWDQVVAALHDFTAPAASAARDNFWK